MSTGIVDNGASISATSQHQKISAAEQFEVDMMTPTAGPPSPHISVDCDNYSPARDGMSKAGLSLTWEKLKYQVRAVTHRRISFFIDPQGVGMRDHLILF